MDLNKSWRYFTLNEKLPAAQENTWMADPMKPFLISEMGTEIGPATCNGNANPYVGMLSQNLSKVGWCVCLLTYGLGRAGPINLWG